MIPPLMRTAAVWTLDIGHNIDIN